METCTHCGSRRDEWDPPHGSAACVAILEAALSAEKRARQEEHADFQKEADILRAGIGIRDKELELTRSRAQDAEAGAAGLREALKDVGRMIDGGAPQKFHDAWYGGWCKLAWPINEKPSSCGDRLRALEKIERIARFSANQGMAEALAALDALKE